MDFLERHLEKCEIGDCKYCQLYDAGILEKLFENMCGAALQAEYGGMSAKTIIKKLNWPVAIVKTHEKRSVSKSRELVNKWKCGNSTSKKMRLIDDA